jgi:hypothetical protein
VEFPAAWALKTSRRCVRITDPCSRASRPVRAKANVRVRIGLILRPSFPRSSGWRAITLLIHGLPIGKLRDPMDRPHGGPRRPISYFVGGTGSPRSKFTAYCSWVSFSGSLASGGCRSTITSGSIPLAWIERPEGV